MLVMRQVPAEQFAAALSRLTEAFPEAEIRCLLSTAEPQAVPPQGSIIFQPGRDRPLSLLRRLRAERFTRAAWVAEAGDRRPRALAAELLIAGLGVREKLICSPGRPWVRVGRARALFQPFSHALEAVVLAGACAAAAAAVFLAAGAAALLSDLVRWAAGRGKARPS
jgi:hypothetical protein